jgi:hypothetical protein
LPPVSKQHRSTASSTHSYYSHSHSQENNYYSQGGATNNEYSDDEMENRNNGGGFGATTTSVLSGRTPSSNRRTTMGSGARRKTPLLGRSVIQSNNREGKKANLVCLSRFALTYLLVQSAYEGSTNNVLITHFLIIRNITANQIMVNPSL